MDLINKLMPTKIQTVVKVFLISIFPFNFDRWAPKYPPVKEPIINNTNIFDGTDPILLKKTAPVKFQKIPTVKNVKLIARRKSNPRVFIKSIVTSNPVPEEIEPFKIPIKKIKNKNLNLWIKFNSRFTDESPKSDLKNEYNANNIEIIPRNKYKYFSDMNSMIEAPNITPGNPKTKSCQAIFISFFKDL